MKLQLYTLFFRWRTFLSTFLGALVGIFLLVPAWVQAELTANLALSNRYNERGIKTSANDTPVLQLGIDYRHLRGFYLGALGFNRDTRVKEGWLRGQVSTGWSWGLDDFAIGAGLVGYSTHGDTKNTLDYHFSGAWRWLRAAAFLRTDGQENYYDLQGHWPFWNRMGLIVGVGLKDREHIQAGQKERKQYYNYSLGFLWAMESDVEFSSRLYFSKERPQNFQDALSLEFTLARRFTWLD